MGLSIGKIEDIDRTLLESRGDEVLPTCWVRTAGVATTLDVAPALVPAQCCSSVLPETRADEAVLVLLGPKPPEVARSFIQDAASSNARVYVLAQHDAFDKASVPVPAAVGRTGARILIRRVPAVAMSGILVDRGRTSGLFLAASSEVSPAWWLPLEPEQGHAAFRYALHQFWHQAADEGWIEDSKIRFGQARERPFDVPLPPRRAPIRPISDRPREACWCWYSPDSEMPTGKPPKRVMVPPSGEDHAVLAKLARNGSDVSWSDVGLPTVVLDEHVGFVLSGTSSHPLRIELTPAQAAAIWRLVDEAADTPDWRFCIDAKLANLNGGVFLPGAKRAAPVIDDHPAQCGAVCADSLRAMPDTKPFSFPEVPPLAREVRWTWTVQPPRAPRAAKQDPLSAAWEKLDADAQGRLDRVREQLTELERRTGALGKAFEALAGALLGFGRARASLMRRVEELADKTPSALGSAANAMLDNIQQVEEQLGKLVGNVDQEEHAAKMEKERKEQLAVFERSKRSAENEKARYQAELQKTRLAIEEAEVELGNLAGDSHGFPEKDRQARQRKLRDDVKSAAGRAARSSRQIAEKQEVLDAEFIFRPSSASTARKRSVQGAREARFVPKARSNPITTAPDEAPPSVGKLLACDGQRYLVITHWEQLDKGEAEGLRLKAKLVAPAEER